MKKLRSLVVDDEPLAREGISAYVQQVEFLELVGQAGDGLTALTMISSLKPDLLLLDVQMPDLNGLDLLRSLTHRPYVILTTAHPSFAIEGFDLAVNDYLLKPIPFPRFLRAVLRVKALSPQNTANIVDTPPTDDPTYFFVKYNGRVERIYFTEILYLEAMQNYVKIQTESGSFLPLTTMKQCLSYLPGTSFLQIHKSYVVNLTKVKAIEGNQVVVAGTYLPISRNRKQEVERRLLEGRII